MRFRSNLPSAGECRTASEDHWQRFWTEGGAIDLSGSTDPRARELERRIVLSQYLLAIQCAGPLPVRDGLYLAAETAPDTWTDSKRRRDHPSMLAACGMLPGASVDREVMRRTLRKVMETWNWGTCWGWDFPMVAMTAARIGKPEIAIDALLMQTPRNHYLPNGHNFLHGGLPVYLTGNGSLLAAAAMMAAGWDGAPDRDAPGFPRDGSWSVRWENLKPMP